MRWTTIMLGAVLGLATAAIENAATHAETIRVPQDYPRIQDAVDAAKSGDIVLVSPGTYHERIRLAEGVTLKSDGDDAAGTLGLKRAEATIIDGEKTDGEKTDGEKTDGSGAGVTMAQGATLDGFTVTNIGKYNEDDWNRHHATRGEEQSHEHIGAPGDPGIAATGVDCVIQHNIVHHIGYSGIGIQATEQRSCSPHVYRNICYRNMGGGIGSMNRSSALIEGNTCFQNFFAGIGHDNASPTVIDNICYENIRAGIGISEGSCPVVRHNQCYKNRRAGIGTRTGAATKPIIENNDCYDNGMAGIGTEEYASPVISKNRCFRNGLAGIGSKHHATPTIIGNECYENGSSGIGHEGDCQSVVLDNHCHHNKASGIGMARCDAGRSIVSHNRLNDNALVAIGINAGWTVHLSHNEMSRESGMPPLVMVAQGANATFTHNSMRGGGVAAIRVAGIIEAVNNEITGTAMRPGGPPQFAIWALPGAKVTMMGNEITHWRHALQAKQADVNASKNTVSQFHRVAFDIQQSPHPANVYGNIVISKDPQAQAVLIDGQQGIVTNNRLQATQK